MVEYWKIFASILAVIIAYVTGNKTQRIDELKKYQEMYASFVKDYEGKYNEVLSLVEDLRSQVNNLESINISLIEDNKKWKIKFSNLKNLYDRLKSEFESYKKNHE